MDPRQNIGAPESRSICASYTEEQKERRRAYGREYYRRKCAERDSNNQTHAGMCIITLHPCFKLLGAAMHKIIFFADSSISANESNQGNSAELSAWTEARPQRGMYMHLVFL